MLSLRRALLLGALHGPAELLPVSSSAHVTAIPWLLGWDYGELDPEFRKAFEVALHAGTAVALVVALGDDIVARRLPVIAAAAAPPAVTGFLLGDLIERHAGTPPMIAAGLAVGSGALLLAARAPRVRGVGDAGPVDGLWLGLAQACALVPGVSRSGATLAAARWRGFGPADAELLSREVALPVLAGAAALEGSGLARRPMDPGALEALAVGGAASFLSTLVAGRWLTREPGGSVTPYALYRLALAGLMIRRAARARRRARSRV